MYNPVSEISSLLSTHISLDFDDDFSRSGVEQTTGHRVSFSHTCSGIFPTLYLKSMALLKSSFRLATNPFPVYVAPATADSAVTQVGTFSFSSDRNQVVIFSVVCPHPRVLW